MKKLYENIYTEKRDIAFNKNTRFGFLYNTYFQKSTSFNVLSSLLKSDNKPRAIELLHRWKKYYKNQL